MISPAETTDDAWPAERRTIERSRANNSSIAERLRQVIVGASVDSVDALGPARARGQDQHRHLTAIRAPALEHGEPVHPRQPEIEDDRAVILGVAAEPGFFAVAYGLDDVARSFECTRQHPMRSAGRPRQEVHASLLLDTFDLAAAGIDIDFEQPALAVDDTKFVAPATSLVFDLDTGDLAGQFAAQAY